ncbi:UNVERIFIED_CONTAM: hypothetical protein FKN15_073660 [Acipenser sinensis]
MGLLLSKAWRACGIGEWVTAGMIRSAVATYKFGVQHNHLLVLLISMVQPFQKVAVLPILPGSDECNQTVHPSVLQTHQTMLLDQQLQQLQPGSTVAGTPPRGAAGHEEGGGGLETTNPSSSFAAGDRGGGQETCSHCSTFAAVSIVAGAPPRGAAGFEEVGGGPETTNPSSSFAARDRGRGQESCSHCSTCAAGDTVAGAPEEGAAGYEEGGRSGDHPPSSLSTAGVCYPAINSYTDSIASSSLGTGNIATREPLEVLVLGPGL